MTDPHWLTIDENTWDSFQEVGILNFGNVGGVLWDSVTGFSGRFGTRLFATSQNGMFSFPERDADACNQHEEVMRP